MGGWVNDRNYGAFKPASPPLTSAGGTAHTKWVGEYVPSALIPLVRWRGAFGVSAVSRRTGLAVLAALAVLPYWPQIVPM